MAKKKSLLKCLNFSIFGLELNKETLFRNLFAEFHYVFKKRKKEIYLIVSVQLTMPIWMICPAIACMAQVISVFTAAVKIRTRQPGFNPQTLHFFSGLNRLLFMIPVSFSWKQTSNQHMKGSLEEKSSHGLKSSLTLVLHQAIQL